uniref:Ovule protein n=1 Tax=Ascaris lumbricoides TaxID=6252 RepID=A0A0M3HR49_ASCLU
MKSFFEQAREASKKLVDLVYIPAEETKESQPIERDNEEKSVDENGSRVENETHIGDMQHGNEEQSNGIEGVDGAHDVAADTLLKAKQIAVATSSKLVAGQPAQIEVGDLVSRKEGTNGADRFLKRTLFESAAHLIISLPKSIGSLLDLGRLWSQNCVLGPHPP